MVLMIDEIFVNQKVEYSAGELQKGRPPIGKILNREDPPKKGRSPKKGKSPKREDP